MDFYSFVSEDFVLNYISFRSSKTEVLKSTLKFVGTLPEITQKKRIWKICSEQGWKSVQSTAQVEVPP